MLTTVCLIAALVCFGLAAIGITGISEDVGVVKMKFNLIALGLFLVTLTNFLR